MKLLIPAAGALLLAQFAVLSAFALGVTEPTSAAAEAFVRQVEKEKKDLLLTTAQASWVGMTYITTDTEAIAARAQAAATQTEVRWAKTAARFDHIRGLSNDTRRKLRFLRYDIVLPAPDNAKSAEALSQLSAELLAIYGGGKGKLDGKTINGSDIEAAMGVIRDPAKLQEMWVSWHDNVGTPMKADYIRLVAITDEGARGLGFSDTGTMWRSGYDMPPAKFTALLEHLWEEVKPLYVQMHCYVRSGLSRTYGIEIQKDEGPIRADLLGNMWAQEWGNIYDMVAPADAGTIGYEVGALLNAQGYDALKMVQTGEQFYSSLGFAPLPTTFWERSQFTKPRDREVVCHASAWDLDYVDDLRIKTCLKVNTDDFATVHHELGHNYYQRAYNQQTILYREGANEAFHEAVGDFIALSITPDYLVKLRLLDPAKVPSADKDIGLLLRQALDKIALLPFSLVLDQWRWGVFDGTIQPKDYESAWNALRVRYQGVVPPVVRPDTAFDPGAKFHVAEVTPYSEYFLARILQLQFYQAACDMAGWKGPLNRCSFYGNKAVGEKLQRMLALGRSKPWPEALELFTGSRVISSKALLAYFQPLMEFLTKQNQNSSCGW